MRIFPEGAMEWGVPPGRAFLFVAADKREIELPRCSLSARPG